MKRRLSIALAALLFLPCCDTERVDKLEKENADLKAALQKSNAASQFDLQQKCSNASKSWFRENWARDKDTILLDETNHYNGKNEQVLHCGRISLQFRFWLWPLVVQGYNGVGRFRKHKICVV